MKPPYAFELVPPPTGVANPPVRGYAMRGIDPLFVQLVTFDPLLVVIELVSAASNQMEHPGIDLGSNLQMLLDVPSIVSLEQNIVGRRAARI
jgi:hypothetical protein